MQAEAPYLFPNGGRKVPLSWHKLVSNRPGFFQEVVLHHSSLRFLITTHDFLFSLSPLYSNSII